MKSLFCFILLLLSQSIVLGQPIQYTIADKPWQTGLGNHRAVLEVKSVADAVHLKLTWGLHDQKPEKKRFLIIDAATGDTVQNVYRVVVNNEQCDIVFGPVKRAGTYYFYYMPFTPDPNPGYYRFDYLSPGKPDKIWVNQNRLSDPKTVDRLPKVSCKKIQARTAFDSFFPMEIIPTTKEKESFLKRHPGDYLLFPESRQYPIKMKDEIPLKWIKEGQQKEFKGTADRNEYYTFQIGLYAAKSDIDSVQVKFSNLTGPQVIPPTKLTCFNTGGIDSYGKSFTKRVNVAKGELQALWMGIDIPPDAKPGLYKGTVTISATDKKAKIIPLEIRVTTNYLADRGDNEPWRYSRLRWLNSTIGISDKPTAPFTAIHLYNNELSLQGKKITIASNAMPASISAWGNEILAGQIKYIAVGEDFTVPEITLQDQDAGRIIGKWVATSKNFLLQGTGSVEFDGYLHYKIRLTALHDVNLKNFKLEIPFKKNIAQYIMGMGLPGTVMPDSLDAKWKGPHDSFWIGNTYGGLYCELLGSAYHGPLLNLYHPQPPASWYNGNKGGFSIRQSTNAVIATVYSGEKKLRKGEEVTYEFDFIITPVKKLNPQSQFTDRYYHNGSTPWPDSSAVAAGIKVINIHQGNSYNPYINYPFLAKKKIKYFSDYWHKKGMKVKIYYTVRELTNHVPELWALLSLDHEILSGGKGGGYPWLREHVVSDYTPAWYTPINNDVGNIDAALETAPGDSRWYNFYVRGLAWLIKNEDIDGIYLDDVAFDRHIIKRMRSVMDDIKSGYLIDLHSNTGFSKGPATQYTAFFPYINKLWFGESFLYNKMPPANWLVECSGIPFGLMGDMLYRGGNPWRGMVYGMTTRLPWTTEGITCDPSVIWKIWDDFGIAHSKMIGYWDKHPVVKTTNPDVLTTAYVKKDKTLISVASWSPEPMNVKLLIDWKALDLNPSKVKMIAPQIKNFQPSRVFEPGDMIPLDPEKGWLLIVKEGK